MEINIFDELDAVKGKSVFRDKRTGKIIPTIDGRIIETGAEKHDLDVILYGEKESRRYTISGCNSFLDAYYYIIIRFCGMVHILNVRETEKSWDNLAETRDRIYYNRFVA